MDDGRWGLYPQRLYKKRTIVALAHGERIDGGGESDSPSARGQKRKKREEQTSAAHTALPEVSSVPSTHSVLMAPAAAMQHQHAALTAEYLRLTKEELPRRAVASKFPIRFDHCFQRVALDYAFQGCWYEHLDRKRGPAIKQIGTEALSRAVAACRRMEAEGVDAVRELDDMSLRWRNKQPKRKSTSRPQRSVRDVAAFVRQCVICDLGAPDQTAHNTRN